MDKPTIASEDALLPAPCADGADVRESESRLRQVVESADSVFILYQLHPAAYLYISPNCSTLLGLDESQLLTNMNWLVHVDDQARIESEYRAAVMGGERAQAEYRIVQTGRSSQVDPVDGDACFERAGTNRTNGHHPRGHR